VEDDHLLRKMAGKVFQQHGYWDLKPGANFIEKPFSLETLLFKVREVLNEK
jgi:DNA-binding response OmpR family regulator